MKPVPLQDAATVVLLRDGSAGLEVLMGKRTRKTKFSAGAYVFPGGAVDPDDTAAAAHCYGLDQAGAEQRFQEPEALRFYLAVARELFEEAGIWLFDGARPSDWDALRRALHHQQAKLSEVLRERESGLNAQCLHYFRFWTTPPGPLRRYRTRFFLALAPADQEVQVDGTELTEHCWTRPQDMLALHASGEVELIFPTRKELERLAEYTSAQQVWSAYCAEQAAVTEIRSRHLIVDGRYQGSLMPGDQGYEDLPSW